MATLADEDFIKAEQQSGNALHESKVTPLNLHQLTFSHHF